MIGKTNTYWICPVKINVSKIPGKMYKSTKLSISQINEWISRKHARDNMYLNFWVKIRRQHIIKCPGNINNAVLAINVPGKCILKQQHSSGDILGFYSNYTPVLSYKLNLYSIYWSSHSGTLRSGGGVSSFFDSLIHCSLNFSHIFS